MSHQNGMWLVLSGAATAPPLYWPCQEMMPMPTSHTGSHTADFQSSGGRSLVERHRNADQHVPDDQHDAELPDHLEARPVDEQVSDRRTRWGRAHAAAGIRYGRSASGTWLRNAARDSGAPAYMSTLAPVITPTSERQLGNGSRKSSPNRNAQISPTHGTPLASILAEDLRDVPVPGQAVADPRGSGRVDQAGARRGDERVDPQEVPQPGEPGRAATAANGPAMTRGLVMCCSPLPT